MKLLEQIYFALAVATTVIGFWQVFAENELLANYWIFMVSFGFFLLYRARKAKNKKHQNTGK